MRHRCAPQVSGPLEFRPFSSLAVVRCAALDWPYCCASAYGSINARRCPTFVAGSTNAHPVLQVVLAPPLDFRAPPAAATAPRDTFARRALSTALQRLVGTSPCTARLHQEPRWWYLQAGTPPQMAQPRQSPAGARHLAPPGSSAFPARGSSAPGEASASCLGRRPARNALQVRLCVCGCLCVRLK